MDEDLFASDNEISIDAKLIEHHAILLHLCNRLETIADTLPNIPNVQECLVLCRDIFPIVKKAHDFEEKVLFPIIQDAKTDNVTIDLNLERLCYEHWEDESFAEEISEVFRSYIDQPQLTDADKLSYMLRGFFEGIRRHIAFETEYLLPLLKN
jgi:hemerythrin-like domain-containing protein